MPAKETPAARIERLIAAGDNRGALAAADELLRQSPQSFLGRFGRARALIRLGFEAEGGRELAIAEKLSPNDEHLLLVRGRYEFRNGRADAAIAVLERLVRGRGAHALEGAFSLLEAYYYAGRRDALAAMVRAGGAWTKDPRAALHVARASAIEDPSKGIESFLAIWRSGAPVVTRRYAGFEAAELLDRAGRYREAFDLIGEVHRTTAPPGDLAASMAPLAAQLAILEKGTGHFKPRCTPAEGELRTAFVVALPRSGTTLLEHMLDRHPSIAGIGEYTGLEAIRRTLAAADSWPQRPGAVPDATFAAMRREYLEGARALAPVEAASASASAPAPAPASASAWTFDKSLIAWSSLPEIATIFPGSVCLAIDRDPRDNATSILFSHLNAALNPWAGDLTAIRAMIGWQRRIVPRALEVLGLAHESIAYEDLVEDPARFAARCLARMDLPMDERVLSPEAGTRVAATLSHAQVRRPINRAAIGRWRNYAWAFDGAWEELVAMHEARRARAAAAGG
jgi:hypothetical protein